MARPIWYVEPGTNTPAHLPPGPLACMPAAGAPGQVSGGWLYGGADIPADGWTTGGSWSVHIPADARPSDFLRIDAIEGPVIDGWVLPEIIRPSGVLAVAQTARMVGGRLAWVPPEHLAGLVERLRAILDQPVEDVVTTDTGLDLVCDLIAVNYHLSPVELGATGWLTTPLARAALIAAVGAARG